MSDPYQYHTSLIVEADALDEMQHVNNVTYLQWVNDIAIEHWQHLASKEMLDNYFWVVLNHFIEYKGQAFLGEELKLITYISEYKAVTCTRIVEIYKEGKLINKTKNNWCLMSAKTKKPTRLTPEIIALFG